MYIVKTLIFKLEYENKRIENMFPKNVNFCV